MPKISVITVCYNEPEVKRTCDSILGQSSGDYEWLVIDGGSAGKCIETLREFADKMTLFVSEKKERKLSVPGGKAGRLPEDAYTSKE